MRQFMLMFAALIFFTLPAVAQDSDVTASPDAETAEPASPAPFIPPDRDAWQVGIGFQYSHYNVLGTPFHDFGLQGDVARYFNNWFAVEGTSFGGFGHAGSNPSIVAKSFFIGGGSHFSLRNTARFEPWVHVLGGWERFRFTQGAILGANSHAAFVAGGGVDYKIRGGRLYWRVQGDFIGIKFGSTLPGEYAIGTGVVLNF